MPYVAIRKVVADYLSVQQLFHHIRLLPYSTGTRSHALIESSRLSHIGRERPPVCSQPVRHLHPALFLVEVPTFDTGREIIQHPLRRWLILVINSYSSTKEKPVCPIANFLNIVQECVRVNSDVVIEKQDELVCTLSQDLIQSIALVRFLRKLIDQRKAVGILLHNQVRPSLCSIFGNNNFLKTWRQVALR